LPPNMPTFHDRAGCIGQPGQLSNRPSVGNPCFCMNCITLRRRRVAFGRGNPAKGAQEPTATMAFARESIRQDVAQRPPADRAGLGHVQRIDPSTTRMKFPCSPALFIASMNVPLAPRQPSDATPAKCSGLAGPPARIRAVEQRNGIPEQDCPAPDTRVVVAGSPAGGKNPRPLRKRHARASKPPSFKNSGD